MNTHEEYLTEKIFDTTSNGGTGTNLSPYVEAYIFKIIENLNSIYGKNTENCIRVALKGQNAIQKNVNLKLKYEKGSLASFLKKIKLHTTTYELTVHVNPFFNQTDYQSVFNNVCYNLLNSGYRIMYGKSLEEYIENLKFKTEEENFTLWKMPVQCKISNHGLKFWLPDSEQIRSEYEEYFGFWQQNQQEYFSSKHTGVIFTLDTSKKREAHFTLKIPFISDKNFKIYYATLLKIDIPTYDFKHSRPIMWRELSKSTKQYTPYEYYISSFLYNTIDTNKENLRTLLKLLNIYHDSLNIGTMKRLSGIPKTEVLLYDDGQREQLIADLTKKLYVRKGDLVKLNTSHIKHLSILLAKNYAQILQNEKYKIIISLYVEHHLNLEHPNMDDLEIQLSLLFDKDIYKYLVAFSQQYILVDMLNFIGEWNEDHRNFVSIRRSFLIPKLSKIENWYRYDLNYSYVFEYNFVFFGNKREELNSDLMKILYNVPFSHIPEKYNVKIVAASEEDLRGEDDAIISGFLVEETTSYLYVFAILLINHVQILHRIPVRIIKIKYVESKPEYKHQMQIVNYNTKNVLVSNQDLLIESVSEAHSVCKLIECMMYLQSLNDENIDYKIRSSQKINSNKINNFLTYGNLFNKTLNEVIDNVYSIF